MSTTTGIGSEEGSPNSVADAETVMGGEEMEGGEEDEINSDDDERAHTNTDNTDTEDGSSVGSGGAGARVDPASYVDLTGDVFCRVVMTRKTPEGGSVPCVCGNPAVTCRRRGHEGKQSRTTSRGLARHYPALPGRTVNSTIDGRMDQGPGLTATEFRMLVQEERDEMDRLASGLEDWSAPEEEQHDYDGAPARQDARRVTIIEEPTSPRRTGDSIRRSAPVVDLTRTPVAPGASILRGHTRASVNAPSTANDLWYGLTEQGHPEARIICLGETDLNLLISQGASLKRIFVTRGEAIIWMNAAPPPPPPNDPASQVWYGLLDARGGKVICAGIADLEELMSNGAQVTEVFNTQDLAIAWLNKTEAPRHISSIMRATPPPVSASYHRPHVAQQPYVGAQGPSTHAPVHAARASNVRGAGPNPLPATGTTTAPAATGGRPSVMGKDPSTGDNTQVYDTVLADTEAMDMALCPPGLVEEDRDKLFEQCIDVAALPGTYKTRQSGVDPVMSVDMEVFAQVAMRSQGGRGYRGNTANLTWQSSSKTAMLKIKTRQDIETLIRKISGVEDKVFRGQNQRISRFMHSRRYLQVDIDDYLDNGLLPFLVRRTYQAYVELLSTARQEAYESSLAWTDGLAKAMVEYHSTKLAETRAFASDWRDCLLGTYVYLRDAKHKSFFAESMTRSLWRQQRSLPGASSPNDTGDEDA